MAKASWNGTVIAESDDIVTVEGNAYFPLESLKMEYFSESATTTVCSWKGMASYYNIVVDGQTNADAAWIYRDPKVAAENIRQRVAFWNGVVVE
jgi:uncharacterized protein (DUF427 family)